ncbi:hypothetical protein T492DRAFT_896762 [Pavlovales sp. CCMP2436]|nr:hypothetical protein T492DRAFT_896762 [Pavlovales sp. CCMP2436]
MQCQPIDSASMNLDGLRRFHVKGVKRTCDQVLMAIQEGLRYIISNTAGGLFFAGGYDKEPVDAILEARKFIEDAIPEEQHCSVYKVCEEIEDGDVVLAATRIYQGITFEGGKLYLDMNMVWDVRMLYVAVSRKARQFGLERSAENGAIEEYPIKDGRYIADLVVFKDGKLVKPSMFSVDNSDEEE